MSRTSIFIVGFSIILHGDNQRDSYSTKTVPGIIAWSVSYHYGEAQKNENHRAAYDHCIFEYSREQFARDMRGMWI